MLAARKKWVTTTLPEATAESQALGQQLALPPLVMQLLAERGLTNQEDIEAFLNPLQQPLNDPLTMHDMDEAIERIQAAVVADEQITIYGDYDADGLTSTSIMYEALNELGAKVNYYIPDRFKDGYGPNQAAYDRLIEAGTKLFITVDNGVAGKAVLDGIQAQGIDVIVTDHHELPDELPTVTAVVHPRHPAGHYAFGGLSGAGVAFKVACALLDDVPQELMDLAAIGTVADLVPLTDENRTIAAAGIQVLRQTTRPGLAALIKAAGLESATLDETSIGFGIAPRLNALGRLQSAAPGVELLTTLDEDRAATLAKEVDSLNSKRQTLVASIADAAVEQANSAENSQRQTLVIVGDNWHEGVLGIAASRVVEATGKPTLVLNRDAEGQLKGSGRSIAAFNLFAAIDPIRDSLVAFGGHHMAVGLTLKESELATLQNALEQAADDQKLAEHGQAELALAGDLALSDATMDTYEAIQKLAPFGTDNPEPIFRIQPTKIEDCRAIGQNQRHLKLKLSAGDQTVDAIGFSFGDAAAAVKASPTDVALAGCLETNTWNGKTSVQVMVKDLQITGVQVIDQRTTHLSPRLFQPVGTYFVFHQRLAKQLQPYLNDQSQLVVFEGPQTDLSLVTSETPVMIVDCPDTLADLSDLLKRIPATQITLYLYQKSSAYLVGMPKREQFAKLFKFTRVHPEINLHQQLNLVAKHLHLEQNLLIFMIQVFFEVGFVKINDGVMTAVAHPGTADLEHAPSYQLRLTQITAEETLLYSKSAALQTWVKTQAVEQN